MVIIEKEFDTIVFEMGILYSSTRFIQNSNLMIKIINTRELRDIVVIENRVLIDVKIDMTNNVSRMQFTTIAH